MQIRRRSWNRKKKSGIFFKVENISVCGTESRVVKHNITRSTGVKMHATSMCRSPSGAQVALMSIVTLAQRIIAPHEAFLAQA